LTVPLQYQYLLHRMPDDMTAQLMDTTTVASTDTDLWFADYPELQIELDSNKVSDFVDFDFDEESWTDMTEITIYDLPTGFYQLTVYSRDDGLERCAQPAWMRFNVQKSTMEKDVLTINFTIDNMQAQVPMGIDSLHTFYREMLEDVLPAVIGEEVQWYDSASEEDHNCRYWYMNNPEDEYGYTLPYSVISQYKTVICVYDNWSRSLGSYQLIPPSLISAYRGLFIDYLDMGGSLFWSGFSSFNGAFGYGSEDAVGGEVDTQAGALL